MKFTFLHFSIACARSIAIENAEVKAIVEAEKCAKN